MNRSIKLFLCLCVGLTTAARPLANLKKPITNRVRSRAAASSPCCSDSNTVLGLKTVVSSAMETAGLLTVLKAGTLASPKVNEWLQGIKFLPSDLPTRVALFLVIFSSSSIKSLIDGTDGAASNQVSKPNVVPGDVSWYQNLKKPWFTPPGWVFPIMWLIVSKPTQFWGVSKLLIGTSSSAAATDATVEAAATAASSSIPWWPALTVYCAHLSLGDAWNQVFFGCQRIGLGAGVIVSFLALLAASAKLFYDLDERAGLLLLPTIGWVTIATCLNLGILRLNRKEESKK